MFTPNLKPNQDPSFTLPAVYVIFTLLNAIRPGIERQNIWREFRRERTADPIRQCLLGEVECLALSAYPITKGNRYLHLHKTRRVLLFSCHVLANCESSLSSSVAKASACSIVNPRPSCCAAS